MKKFILSFFLLSALVTILFAVNPPANLPTNTSGNKGVVANADGSMSVSGDQTQPSQVGLRSTNGANFCFITGPTNATVTYNIYLPSVPTNGVFVVSASGTNLFATFVQGITQNLDVISPGASQVTNRVFISNGVITNITQL